MSVAIITGSAGLIGSEATRHFAERGLEVVGIDNDMRRYFFGDEASTAWNREQIEAQVPGYRAPRLDIRDRQRSSAFSALRAATIELVIHTAAQPSHDWAAREPRSTSRSTPTARCNLLEATRQHAPDAVFIFTSTNKVYGDTPNRLPLVEQPTALGDRSRLTATRGGISEDMSIDQTLHSLFGASKVAADVLVQEYGRYFGLHTACFRGGCLTGPNHSGAQLHGFLAYLMKCADHRHPLHRVRLPGQAGARQHPQRRPDPRLRRILPARRVVGGGVQHRRRALQQLLDAGSDRALRGDQRGASWRGRYAEEQPHRRPHLVDQRQQQVRLATTRPGSLLTTCRASWKRCTSATCERWLVPGTTWAPFMIDLRQTQCCSASR